MTPKINKEAFHQAYGTPGKLKTSHGQVKGIDGKIATVSGQLFAIKHLIQQETSREDIQYYKKIAENIFQEKFHQTNARGRWNRFISALANWRRGRGFQSTDHMLQKIQAKPTPIEVPKCAVPDVSSSEVLSNKLPLTPVPSVETATPKSVMTSIDHWSSDLLPDILQELSLTDLINLSQTSARFNAIVPKFCIQRTLNAVKLFNEIFQKDFMEGEIPFSLTKNDGRTPIAEASFFKFNEAGWKKTLINVKKASKSSSVITNARTLIEESHYDLLEALAEYRGVSADYLNLIKLPESSGPAISYANTVLSLAKKTMKVFGKIEYVAHDIQPKDLFNCPTQRQNRPFCQFKFYTASGITLHLAKWLHYDWFIGKKQGDRLILKTEHVQYIVRLNRLYAKSFEHEFTAACLSSCFSRLDPAPEQIRNEVLQELTDAYGEKVLEEAKQDL